MDYITLGQLSNFAWYVQKIIVKDEKYNIIFNGENIELQKVIRNDEVMRNRWVKGFGADDNVLIVVTI